MSAIFQSLRWRLQIWHGIILLVTVAALCGAVLRLALVDRYNRTDRDVTDSERMLIRSIIISTNQSRPAGSPPSSEDMMAGLRAGGIVFPEFVQDHFSGTEPGYRYFIIRDRDGTTLLQSPNAPVGRELLPFPSSGFNEQLRTADHFRESHRSSADGFASVVGRDISVEQDQIVRFAWSVALCGLATWLVGLFGGWWLAGRAIKPIAAISATASRIAEGNLRERIDSAGTDNELDQLSQVLNDTFDRLQAAFERQRRFTADAAHELRTPVTILLSETQRMLRRPHTVEGYQRSLQTCQDTAQRMRRLTEALLLLARQEAADEPRPAQDCDLAQLARDTLAHLAPIADEHHVQCHADLAPATCRADPDALGILINNLVANAIHHHHADGGQIWVSTRTTDGNVVLEVRDDGPGIPAASLPHIFERFHRADQARTGGSPRTGLGLAIAQVIVVNHGGTLTARNAPETGAVFTATLPV